MKQLNLLAQFLLSFLFIAYFSTSALAQVVVNEYSAGNFDDVFFTIGFEEEYDDWVELHNPTGADIDISGYHLSDDPDEPDKWAFPAGAVVPANDHLLVFCSNLDGFDYGYYHTSFKLNQTSGEWVIFADPAGAVLESYQFEQPTQGNHSYGRATDAGSEWKIFPNTTPGEPNVGDSYSAYAEDPDYDISPGYHPAPVTVEITTEEPESDIYYTTDGSTPSDASTPYTGPVDLNETTVLKAIAYHPDPDIYPSFVETTTFFIGDDQHTMHVLSIAGDDIVDGWFEGRATLELFDENGEQIDEVDGETNEHGNDSNAYGQRGFDYIARDQVGIDDDIDHDIFFLTERNSYQRLIMKAAANDNYPFEPGAHIRDAYVQSLSQVGDLELDERSHRSVIAYVNGEYWGVYEMREKVDDLDYTDFYYDQPEGFVDFLKTWGGTWEEYGSIDDWNELRDFILANDMSIDANYEYVESQYEVMSLIDYFVMNSYIVSADWLNWNTGWWRGTHPEGEAKKWRYILWDMDATFGHYINYTGIPDTGPYADPCDPEGYGDPGGQGHVPILNALFDNEQFEALYINRYADLSNTIFSCDFMNSHLDSLLNIIEPEMPRQVERWGGSMAGWEAEVQELRDFIDERCADVLIEGIEDCYDVTAHNVTIEIEGIGEVQISTVGLNQDDTPWEGTYFGGLPIDLDAFTDTGLFLYWEVVEGDLDIDDPTDPDQTIVISGDVTIVAHFANNLDPQMVKFESMPPNGGDIILDGSVLNPLPQTIELEALEDHDLIASPNEWFVFDHWEAMNNNIDPNTTADTASVFITSTDTIVAVFEELEHYSLTVGTEPEGVGSVELNGEVVPAYPFTDEYAGGEAFSASAIETGEWIEFSHWELNNNPLTPSELSQSVNFFLNDNDTLIAHFNEIEHYPLTVMVDPIYQGGEVYIDEEVTVQAEHTAEYEAGVSVSLRSKTNEHYVFKGWEANNHEIQPNETSREVAVIPFQTDTIVAVFEKVPHSFYVPNSFTPNNDGINDRFKPEGLAVESGSYKMQIFNRWGERVFQTTDITEGWDGSDNRGDYYVEEAIYFYLIEFRSVHDTEDKELSGHITVVR